MKKVIICFILTTGIFSLLFSCCKQVEKYWNVTTIEASLYDYPDSTTQVTTDTLALQLSFGVNLLAQHQSTFIDPFINRSYAFYCHEPGYGGMKDELTQFVITSNANFNNYPVGISLVPIISIGENSLEHFMAQKYYNSSYFYHKGNHYGINDDDFAWVLSINEKPTPVSNIHDFKITLTFASGRIETIQTGAITWN